MAVSITTWMVMPVIPKPEGFKPFGGMAVVMFGGYNIGAMRRWQERVRAADQQPSEEQGEADNRSD